MSLLFEICDYNDYDPLNGKFTPFGVGKGIWSDVPEPSIKKGDIIKPFLQSYAYLVIGFDQMYGIVKIIPHCNFAKKVFDIQYKKIKL